MIHCYKAILLNLIVVIAVSAEPLALSGTVTNKSGSPIAGAIVSLVGQVALDTTDENGRYSLIEAGVIRRMVSHSDDGLISLRSGEISFTLKKAVPVHIVLFDIRGRRIGTLLDQTVGAGNYRFTINRTLSPQLMFVHVTIDNRTATFRYVPGRTANHCHTSYLSGSVSEHSGTLANVPVAIDTITVWKSGYVLGIRPVASYTGTEDLTLDTITLPRFSFFVTSLKAILELSKSDSGFGGDLRFGFTGPGAGLRGADSICSCIAEKSMPGSSVKLWRAFLSATADARGRQVNAIERIGNGPWYDRLGRLLAPTLADLQNDRPANGDPTIKNDLPNEDGVPNHRPDPTLPEVDNHHFVTGSNTKGMLYSATATCADWTSKDAPGRPRCGFSWPRGSGGGMMGGTNWISGFDAGGCAAGIELTANNLNGKIIGNAGGYGGFYCFALTP